VEWATVGGAQTYTIYKKVNNGNFQAIKTVNSDVRSYTDTAIKVGNQYSYIIRATSYYGIVSGNSNMKCARAIDPNKPMVALTYDDGPSSSATTRVLNTLEKHNARATFFVVGSRVDSYKSQIQRIHSLNCEIGNHSYNHKTLTSISASEVRNELDKTADKVEAITGERPVIMRPPGGSYKTDTVRNNVNAPIIMWSVDTRDWESRNASSVVSNIKNNVYDGSIVLMHDLYDSTASATETIVPWLVKNGYQIVTVTEMMDARGITMKNGVAYNSAG
jgi:peptidoglycan/xylan/chitin deacetylase (PgdA/CDA1 family)